MDEKLQKIEKMEGNCIKIRKLMRIGANEENGEKWGKLRKWRKKCRKLGKWRKIEENLKNQVKLERIKKMEEKVIPYHNPNQT